MKGKEIKEKVLAFALVSNFGSQVQIHVYFSLIVFRIIRCHCNQLRWPPGVCSVRLFSSLIVCDVFMHIEHYKAKGYLIAGEMLWRLLFFEFKSLNKFVHQCISTWVK